MAKMLLGGGRRRRETTFALIFLSDGLQTVDNLKLFVFKLYSKLLSSNYTIQPFKKVNNYCIQFSRHDNKNMFSCRQGGKSNQ